MYGGFPLFLMRLFGLISPSELRTLGHAPPSSAFHVAHNFLILVAIGGTLAYAEMATYELAIIQSKGKMVAYVVISGLAKIWGAFALFFLVIRNILFHKSYSTLTPILNGAINFEAERFRRENRFNWFISIFLIASFSIRVLSALNFYEGVFELWIFLDSFSIVLSNFYVMLFATKFVFLTRMVRFNFQIANRFLKRYMMEKQPISWKVPEDGLNLILKLQWKTHTFLDLLNNKFGAELAVFMSYIYVGILRNLYNASISSALFTVGDPDVSALAIDLFKAGHEIIMSLIVLSNGDDLTKETKSTQALIWNAVPNVHSANSKMQLTSFVTRVSQLPSDLTANRIFKLNTKTFCNIISSVATQLVILISMGNQ